MLAEIQQTVAAELSAFTERYDAWLRSKDSLWLESLIEYLAQNRGKLLRPTLTYLAAKATGGVSERTHCAALVVELLHNATLVHDDVVDQADRRRGQSSLNSREGDKVSVLMGDFLLARAMSAMSGCGDHRVYKLVAEVAGRLAHGELEQLDRARSLRMDEDAYFNIITDKTGGLIGVSCQLGAITSGADESQGLALARYGEALGVAFQIRDDLLDYEGDAGTLGKPVGGDLREGKITLPLLHALSHVEGDQRSQMRNRLHNPGDEDVSELIDFVRRHGGIAHARQRAEEYCERACDALAVLPDSSAREMLIRLGRFAIRRNH